MEYDLILRNGTLYDGSGAPGVAGDLAINGQTIAALGQLKDDHGRREGGDPDAGPGAVRHVARVDHPAVARGLFTDLGSIRRRRRRDLRRQRERAGGQDALKAAA